jgi:hypothetical protein
MTKLEAKIDRLITATANFDAATKAFQAAPNLLATKVARDRALAELRAARAAK